MLGRVMEEFKEECRIEGAISMGKTMGLTNAQLVDSVSKSCNTTKEVVKEYLEKMK